MSSAPTTVRVTDRQDIASRLLASSAKKSYDPMVEVDWDAPVPEHLFGMTPEWSTLYGTPLWEEMSLQQQVTLTKHEVSSIMSTGIWFEMILMQMVVRDMYGKDASQPHYQFALTEIADECRPHHVRPRRRALWLPRLPAQPDSSRARRTVQDDGDRGHRVRRDPGCRGDSRRAAAGLDEG